MSKSLVFLLIAVTVSIVTTIGLGYYYFVVKKSTNSQVGPVSSWEEAAKFIGSNCKEIPTLKDDKGRAEYVNKLLYSLEPTSSKFRHLTIPVQKSKKFLQIISTEYCWVALLEEDNGLGKLAYFDEQNNIRNLEVSKYPIPDAWRLSY